MLEAEVSRLQDGIKENLVYLAEKKSSIAKLGDEVQGLVKDKLEMQQKLLNAEEILVPKDNMIADQQKQIKVDCHKISRSAFCRKVKAKMHYLADDVIIILALQAECRRDCSFGPANCGCAITLEGRKAKQVS